MALLRFLPYAGWPLAAILGWMWLEAREDLAAEKERCNADKLSAIVEAEKITREAQERAFGQRIAQLERIADQREVARRIAEEARIEAENRPEKVRTVIERVRLQDACIDTSVHPDLLGCLRDSQNCGEVIN